MDTKSQLIDQGYECRSGHTTGDWADFGWSHDTIGKEYSFVVVKKDFPEIKHIGVAVELTRRQYINLLRQNLKFN